MAPPVKSPQAETGSIPIFCTTNYTPCSKQSKFTPTRVTVEPRHNEVGNNKILSQRGNPAGQNMCFFTEVDSECDLLRVSIWSVRDAGEAII